SNMELDATQLGRARELVDHIRTRLNVAERVLNAEDIALNDIDLDQNDDIVGEIASYFGDHGCQGAQPEDAYQLGVRSEESGHYEIR
ncbi:MAG: hypothetical protein AAGD07_16400, partial [Planctomycetota bacterium]